MLPQDKNVFVQSFMSTFWAEAGTTYISLNVDIPSLSVILRE